MGKRGHGDGQFQNTYGPAVDGSGNVYVVDNDQSYGTIERIQKFDNAGAFLTKWGSTGSGDGQFSYHHGIAVDGSGSVFVADSGNARIQKFDNNGAFLTKWGSLGSGDGQFYSPQLNSPAGVAIDGSGNVFVVDNGNSRIQKFTNTGIFVGKWGSSGTGDGQFAGPFGIAVDGNGNVYVADTGNSRIQKFDNTGTFLTKWGSYGNGDGQFYSATGIAVTEAGTFSSPIQTASGSKSSRVHRRVGIGREGKQTGGVVALPTTSPLPPVGQARMLGPNGSHPGAV